MQGKEPGVLVFGLKKKIPWALGQGPARVGRSPSPESGGGRSTGSLSVAWIRGLVPLFAAVGLVAKFLERFRQWGGLPRGRFGESPRRGGRGTARGPPDTRAPEAPGAPWRQAGTRCPATGARGAGRFPVALPSRSCVDLGIPL